MMIEGSIVTILLFCWLFLRAARESEEKPGARRAGGGARRRADARSGRRGRSPRAAATALRERIEREGASLVPGQRGAVGTQ